jgi:tetratricopeptide (TPR) repeat protein
MTQSMMENMPVRPPTHLASHGRTLYFSGQQRAGIKFLIEAVTQRPGTNQARMSLIVALHEAGEYTQAAEHYQQLLRNTTKLNASYFGKRWAYIPEIRDRYLLALGAYGLSA